MGSWQAGDYADINDIKIDQEIVDSTGEPVASTKDDNLIWQLIHESSREIDSFCSRHFYGVVETRYFDALESVDGQTLLLDEDLAAVGTITLGTGDTLDSSDYVLLPYNSTPKHQIRLKASSSEWWSYNDDPEGAISVSGTWGYTAGTTPPDAIKRACISLVRWRYRQRQAPFEQAGMGDLGTYTVASGMPEDIQRMLLAFRRFVIGDATTGGYW